MDRSAAGDGRVWPAFLLAVSLAAGAWTATAEEAQDDEPQAAAAAEPADERYVVHDQLFVQERAPEIPASSTAAAKLPLSVAETPVSVSMVDDALLEERNAEVLGDALRNVAGVNVQSGSGIFDVFMLRGLDSSEGLILTDGAPEPQTAFLQLYNVERVEVLRGPTSFLYGGRTLGGVVNLVHKQPIAGSFTRFGLSGGSFSTYEGTVDANYAVDDGRWGVRVNGLWRQSDLYRDDKEMEVFGVNPTLVFRPSERTSLHLSLEHLEADASPDAGLPLLFTNALPDVPRTNAYESTYDVSEHEISRLQLDVETRISDDLVIRNKTYHRRFDWLSTSTILNGAFPDLQGGFVVSRNLLALDDHQRFTGNQLEAVWTVGGNVRHHLLFGLELARLTDDFTFDVSLLPAISLVDPIRVGPEQLFTIQRQSADAESTVVAPYVVDQIRFSDQLQLLLGVRYDDIDFEDDAVGLSRSDGQLSPMVGVVYSPTAAVSLYANAGEAFAPQSTFVNSENREPEESQQVEVGARATLFDGKLAARLALYRLERENVAIPDPFGIPRQTGAQRSDGIELELGAELGERTRARFTYSYTDAELTEFTEQVIFSLNPFIAVIVDHAGNTPPWVPEHIVNLWLSHELGNGFGFGAGGSYVSEQFIAANNDFAVDAYATLDAAIFYTRKPWRLQLNLENLTDEETYTRVFGGNAVVPAPGFTASAGIRFGI